MLTVVSMMADQKMTLFMQTFGNDSVHSPSDDVNDVLASGNY